MASLPRSMISLALSRRSALRRFRYSLPSSALPFRISRVSCPVLGANKSPIPTPTPTPSKKLANPSLSISFSFFCSASQKPRRSPAYVLFQYTPHQPINTRRAVNFCTSQLMREKRTRAPRRLDAVALWDYAVKALASRACSSGELRQKLIARAATKDDVEASMSRLKDYGYLDDRRFADSFAVARLENQRMGKARVLQDLRRRRVAPVVAEASVQ